MLKVNKYFKNIFTLAGGTGIAQLIPVAISPLLAKLYTPEDFGIYSFFLSTSMLALVISTLKLEFTVLLAKDNRAAKKIISSIISIAFFFSILSIILILLYKALLRFEYIKTSSSMMKGVIYLPLFTLFSAIFIVVQNYLNRVGSYSKMVLVRITRTAVYSLIAILLGYLGIKHEGLIFAEIIGYLSAVVLLLFFVKLKFKINLKDIKQTIITYKKFPIYSVPSGVMERFSVHAPVYILGLFFLESVIGYYALANRLIKAPTALISKAIGDVFKEQATREYNIYGNCRNVFLRTLKRLLIISTPIFILMYILEPIVFDMFFSNEWKMASEMIQIMLIMFFLQFIVSPLSKVFFITQNQQLDLYFQIGLSISILIIIPIKYYFFNDWTSITIIKIYTLIYSVKYIIEGIISYKLSINEFKK